MDFETALHEKILVLQRALPPLKKVELDIGKDEAVLNELTEEMRKVAACLSFVPEQGTLDRVERLA